MVSTCKKRVDILPENLNIGALCNEVYADVGDVIMDYRLLHHVSFWELFSKGKYASSKVNNF